MFRVIGTAPGPATAAPAAAGAASASLSSNPVPSTPPIPAPCRNPRRENPFLALIARLPNEFQTSIEQMAVGIGQRGGGPGACPQPRTASVSERPPRSLEAGRSLTLAVLG